MNLLRFAPRIPLYYLSRNMPRRLCAKTPFPFNLTISVTSKCNSKCKTCNIWKKDGGKELNFGEWEKIFKSLGESPFWVTLSGGEPFLRNDFVKLAEAISKYNNPAVLNIATNGILTKKITRDVKRILSFYKGKLIINISIDGIEKKHDYIRGVKCFDNVLKTYKALRKIRSKNLSIGLHTVVSRYNVNDFEEIYNMAIKLKPDSFIIEIAEKRKELLNLKSNISPHKKGYFKVVDFLLKNRTKHRGISRVTQMFRKGYYKTTKKCLNGKNPRISCYAGIASCQISYNGGLIVCCIKGEVIGNLKNKSFKELWESKKAEKIRERIRSEKCFCTLANVYYSNRICDIL